VVRYGGEEFVVLLRRCGAAEAVTIAEALRTAVRQVALPADCPLEQLTVSIGIAAYPEDGTDLDLLLGAADRAMYTSKHTGRDRVTRAPEASAPSAIVSFPAGRGRFPRRNRGTALSSQEAVPLAPPPP
jgi:predicted signal transduction protein with EAL and GGDEF domain